MMMNNKFLRFSIIICIFIVHIVFFASCIKPDMNPRLEISVVDTNGDPVPEAYVSLYEDIDEWGLVMNPVQVWKQTDSTGKVLFVGLNEIVYYFMIKKGELDNSEGFIVLENPLIKNELVRILVTIR